MIIRDIEDSLGYLQKDEIFLHESHHDILETLSNLKIEFEFDFDSAEAIVFVSKALNVINGIPNFITRASNQHVEQGIAKEAVQLLEIIIKKHSKAMNLLIGEFLKWCVNVVAGNMNALLKASVIKIGHLSLKLCSLASVNWEEIITPLRQYIQKYGKPPTVMESIFLFLAEISEHHPEQMCHHVPWFYAAIKSCVFNQNVKQQSPKAAFFGLNGLLGNFPPKDEQTLECFHKQLLICMKLKTEAKQRNTTARAAGEVFQRHAFIFADFISKNHLTWHKLLLEWLADSLARENQLLGLQCLSIFYQIMSKHILTLDTKEGSSMLSNYICHFAREQYCCTSNEVKDILLGLTEFTPAFKKFSSVKEISMLMNQAMSQLKRIPPSVVAMQLELLSKMEVIPEELTRQCVALMSDFPVLSSYEQPFCLASLERTLLHWNSEDKNFKFHLNVMIYQTLLSSCAGPIAADVELLAEHEELVSYKQYLPLWKHLLTIHFRDHDESHRCVGHYLINAFIDNFLKIINKLNLTLTCVSHKTNDPSIALESECPNDFLIFVNLVDLFQDLSSVLCFEKTKPRVHEIVVNMVRLGMKYRMVSGFLKVISSCFMSTANLWDDADLPEVESFLGKVLEGLVSQKDDLLVSSLCLILSSPVRFLLPHSPILHNLPTIAVKTATSYTELWVLLLDALIRWQPSFPDEDLSKMVAPALPSFMSHLYSADFKDKSLYSLQRKFLAFLASLDESST